jgi:hypothetical protein
MFEFRIRKGTDRHEPHPKCPTPAPRMWGDNLLVAKRKQWAAPPPDNHAQATPLGTRCSLHTTRSSPLAQPCLVQKKARWYAPSMANLYPGRPRPIAGDRPVQQIDICGVDYKTKMKLGSDYTHGVHAAPSSLRQALYLSLFKVLRRVRLQQLLILFSKYDQFKFFK